MFHWFGVVQNTRGDALANWQVGLVEVDTQNVVPIFADENSTPIATVSGVANRAVADLEGNYDFYVPSGTYTLRFFNSAGEFQRDQRFVAMFGADIGNTALIARDEAVDAAQDATDAASSAAADAAIAQGAASIAAQFSGPLYLTISAGLAGTTNNQEFAVDNGDGTATIYLNDEGDEVLRRVIIIAPQRPEASANIGFSHAVTPLEGSVAAKLKAFVSVKDAPYNAKGDGVTNDTAAIQAAINAVSAAGGGTVLVPAGNYRLNSGLTYNGNNLTIEGEGPRATRFTSTFATGDIIRIGNGTANPDNVTLTGFAMSSTVARTSGAAIVLQNTFNCAVRDFRLDANMFDGVLVEGGPNQFQNYISDFVIDSGSNGILLGNAALVQGIYITSGLIANCTGAGIFARNVSGWYIDHLDIIRCKDGITTFPAAGQQTNAAFLADITADTSTEYGFLFLSNGGFCGDLNLVGCWAATCGEDGVFINEGAGNVSGILLSACRFINNGKAGFRAVTGDHITLENCHSFSNSTDGLNTADGIAFGNGMGNFSVIGGSSCNTAGLFPGGNQRAGISIGTGCDNFAIIGVDVQNNATAGIIDSSTGLNKTIAGCPGFRTAASGTATVLSGNSSVNVTHTLSVTPGIGDIQATPTSDVPERWWVSATSSTTFTITFSGPAGANRTFAWSARTRGA